MPKASRQTASETVAVEGLDVRLEHLEGGYSVCFESHSCRRRSRRPVPWLARGPLSTAPLGVRPAREGDVPLRRRRSETYEAGDAYYVPPGHTPVHHAGAELVEFSPTNVLLETMPVVMENLRALHGQART